MGGKDGSSSTRSYVILHNVQDAPFPTGVILDDKNYPLWSQLMDMRSGARNKSRFLTGASKKPTKNEKQIETLLTNNNRVKSWLIDSMIPTLMRHFIRLQMAVGIWEADSKTFYDGTDKTQLFELKQKSFHSRQNGQSLPAYYNELVSLFQDIDTRLTGQEDTVEDAVVVNKTLSYFRVHIFLAGLDSEFSRERSKISRKDPPLSLEARYAYIRKYQNQRQTVEEPKQELDSVFHMASKNRLGKERAQREE